MKKIILVVATFITVAGIAFAASCYKYHYVLSARCQKCGQTQTMEVDRDSNGAAFRHAESTFSNHSEDCECKKNSCILVSITSKNKNEYEKCN